MLNAWMEILPLCLIRLLARKCERVRVGTKFVTVPRPGVMIEANEKPPAIPESQYALGIGA